MVGLDAAGKTTILDKLQQHCSSHSAATLQPVPATHKLRQLGEAAEPETAILTFGARI